MNSIVNENDFKYYMQDIERHYLGARYSYQEILDNEMTPFKFKSIITKYLKEEIPYDTTLESHLYHLNKEGFDYQIYKQLKARVRVTLYKNPDKIEKGYTEKVFTIIQLAAISPEEKEAKGMIIRELILSKLALFGFSI